MSLTKQPKKSMNEKNINTWVQFWVLKLTLKKY